MAGRRHVRSPKSRQGQTGNHRIQAHNHVRQRQGRLHLRMRRPGGHAHNGAGKTNGEHQQSAPKKALFRRSAVFSRTSYLYRSLGCNSLGHHHHEPTDNRSQTQTAYRTEPIDARRQRSGNSANTALIINNSDCADQHAYINQRNAENVGQSRRPQPAQNGRANKDRRTGNHASLEGKNIRQQRRQNSAACQILQRRNNQLNGQHAQDSNDPAFFIVIPFKQFGNRSAVKLPIFFSRYKGHHHSASRPGAIIPTGGNARLEGVLRHADGSRRANRRAGDIRRHQRRSQFTSGKQKAAAVASPPLYVNTNSK